LDLLYPRDLITPLDLQYPRDLITYLDFLYARDHITPLDLLYPRDLITSLDLLYSWDVITPLDLLNTLDLITPLDLLYSWGLLNLRAASFHFMARQRIFLKQMIYKFNLEKKDASCNVVFNDKNLRSFSKKFFLIICFLNTMRIFDPMREYILKKVPKTISLGNFFLMFSTRIRILHS